MKRLLMFALVSTMIIALAATAYADPKGAVKTDIYVTGDTENIVGWAVLNTNADGMLVVVVHLDEGEPDAILPVYVKIDGAGLLYVGDIMINSQGKGTVSGKVEIPEGLETLVVRAQVKNLVPPPINQYKSDPVPVPMKK